MMWWDGDSGFGAAEITWMVVMIAVVALIVVGIVLLIRGLSSRHDGSAMGYQQGAYPQTPPVDRPEQPGAPQARSALQILKERYARGEIDRDEFLRMRADLASR